MRLSGFKYLGELLLLFTISFVKHALDIIDMSLMGLEGMLCVRDMSTQLGNVCGS